MNNWQHIFWELNPDIRKMDQYPDNNDEIMCFICGDRGDTSAGYRKIYCTKHFNEQARLLKTKDFNRYKWILDHPEFTGNRYLEFTCQKCGDAFNEVDYLCQKCR